MPIFYWAIRTFKEKKLLVGRKKELNPITLACIGRARPLEQPALSVRKVYELMWLH